MTLKAQLEEMTLHRNRLRDVLARRDKQLVDQGKELEDKIAKIKDQAEQISWLKQMNQTLTRKIPNYAGA